MRCNDLLDFLHAANLTDAFYGLPRRPWKIYRNSRNNMSCPLIDMISTCSVYVINIGRNISILLIIIYCAIYIYI